MKKTEVALQERISTMSLKDLGRTLRFYDETVKLHQKAYEDKELNPVHQVLRTQLATAIAEAIRMIGVVDGMADESERGAWMPILLDNIELARRRFGHWTGRCLS